MSAPANDIAAAGVTWARALLPGTVNVYAAGTEDIRELPAVLVDVSDLREEEPPLRGHYGALLSFTLTSAVEDTTKATHDETAWLLEKELLAQNGLCSALAGSVGTLHNLSILPGSYEDDDGRRSYTFGARVKFTRHGIPPAPGASPYLVAGTGNYLVP